MSQVESLKAVVVVTPATFEAGPQSLILMKKVGVRGLDLSDATQNPSSRTLNGHIQSDAVHRRILDEYLTSLRAPALKH